MARTYFLIYVEQRVQFEKIPHFPFNPTRHCGIVVMDFDCYTGDRSSIEPSPGSTPVNPMPC